jgi:hypothetical protein
MNSVNMNEYVAVIPATTLCSPYTDEDAPNCRLESLSQIFLPKFAGLIWA